MPVIEAAPDLSAAAPLRFETLQKRSDFLKAARARRVPCGAFLLQARKRGEGEADTLRVGFTCSKKVGNAVARNRAKRRLREIARLVLPHHGRADHDYVLIGRAQQTADTPFTTLIAELTRALQKLHGRTS